VLYENHDVAQFRNDGHFVPEMQDEYYRRRKWKGKRVHILTLYYFGQAAALTQILRVYGDTLAAAEAHMAREIKNTFFAWWTAQQIQANTGTALLQAQTERNTLADFIRAKHGQAELSTILNPQPVTPPAATLLASTATGSSAQISRLQCQKQIVDGQPWRCTLPILHNGECLSDNSQPNYRDDTADLGGGAA